MAKLPKAVADAAARAEALVKEAARNTEDTDDTTDDILIDDAEVVEDDEQAVDIEDDTPTPDEEPDEEPEAQPEEDTIDYKQQYKVLQGKYNSEVPALAQQVRELQEQATVAAAPQAKDADEDELNLTPEEFEDYGEEFTKLVKVVNTLKKRNEHLEMLTSSMDVNQRQSAENTFTKDLTKACPNWEQLNKNPNFIEWLQQPEGITGQSKHFFLLRANTNKDAETVAMIFNTFATEYSSPDDTEENAALEQELTPSTTTSNPPLPGKRKQGREWTRKQIAEFYKNKAMGKITGNKAIALEADIFKANQEGRIKS